MYFPIVGRTDTILYLTVTCLALLCQFVSLIPSRGGCPALLCQYVRLASCTPMKSIARLCLSQIISERKHSSLEVNVYVSRFFVGLNEDFHPAV